MIKLAAHEAAPAEDQGAIKPHILIVDDSPGICDMLCQALTLDGYIATGCAAREAWIDRAMHFDPPPALILLDLSIPSMDETVFLQSLRTRWQAAPPIVVMTTSKAVYEALAPVERVICKPFHLCDLRSEVQKMLSHPSEFLLAGKGA